MLASGIGEVSVAAILKHLGDLMRGNGNIHGVIYPAEYGTHPLLAGLPDWHFRVQLVFRGLTYDDIDGLWDLGELNCKVGQVEFTEGIGLPALQVRVEVLLWNSQREAIILG